MSCFQRARRRVRKLGPHQVVRGIRIRPAPGTDTPRESSLTTPTSRRSRSWAAGASTPPRIIAASASSSSDAPRRDPSLVRARRNLRSPPDVHSGRSSPAPITSSRRRPRLSPRRAGRDHGNRSSASCETRADAPLRQSSCRLHAIPRGVMIFPTAIRPGRTCSPGAFRPFREAVNSCPVTNRRRFSIQRLPPPLRSQELVQGCGAGPLRDISSRGGLGTRRSHQERLRQVLSLKRGHRRSPM